MNILTWNINGIRATKIPLVKLFDKLDADIVCLQETKVTRDQLDEPSAIIDGYTSYFSFSKSKSGYSGVATFVKDRATPFRAETGLTGFLTDTTGEDTIGYYGEQSDFTDEELQALDNEGRAVLTQHKIRTNSGCDEWVTIINVYCPRADPENPERKLFKQQFYKLLQIRAESLLEIGHVIILGDINTSHKRIDHCDPGDDKEFEANPGRQWLNAFLRDPQDASKAALHATTTNPSPLKEVTVVPSGGKFVDTFRVFHPDQEGAYTCWSTVTGARATNYGVRIDYILADVCLAKDAFTDCVIKQDIQGSDHCPVKASLHWNPIPSPKCPQLCSRWLPEFSGKQQKLSQFFLKNTDHVHIMKNTSHSESYKTSSFPAKSSQQKPLPVKRAGSVNIVPASKKQKLHKKGSGARQGSLLSFFSKGQCDVAGKRSDSAHLSTNDCIKSEDSYLTQGSRTSQNEDVSVERKLSTASWKNIFKGPPSAPLCQGHKEPCVLRTVKKDSLNKGRQFWVCTRPEGHKTNPEARCEHFEWVIKKK